MKISIEIKKEYSKIPFVHIQCQEENDEVRDIVQLLEYGQKHLVGVRNQKDYIIKPQELLYCECVDGVTYLYTVEEVYKSSYTLNELELNYSSIGYFRCAKSTVLNIHAITQLKSEIGNRIDACLENGEHIIISRRYAKELRRILKGGEE